MRRRTVLRETAGLGVLGLTGCVGLPGSDRADSPTNGSTPSPTATVGQCSVANRSLTVQDRLCGSDDDSATVTVDGRVVTITGTAVTPNPCYDARLGTTTCEADTLRVNVETVEANGGDPCVSCLGNIEYEAELQVEGDRPDRVVVAHDGERITDHTPDR